MVLATEHSTKIEVEVPKKISAEMGIFYNPLMISNRNISILLLNSLPQMQMNIADVLAGSGIRSLRFIQELNPGKINTITVNDVKENFVRVFEKNLKLNQIKKKKKIFIGNEEAHLFLLKNRGFDYIEIDPFGSPNPFLAAAVARISRSGILAVTATDTAALTGTYPSVTKRKYWAVSLKNYMMHETGLRILIRKIQLQGIQFDRALIPLLAYHKDHYFRVYFSCEKGKEKCDELIKQHQYLLFCPPCLNFRTSHYNKENCICGKTFQFAGPLWTGKMINEKLIKIMVKENPFPEEQKFLDLLCEESPQDAIGFYDLHEVARKLKVNPPPMAMILKKLKAVRTHFSPTGIKWKGNIEEIFSLFLSG